MTDFEVLYEIDSELTTAKDTGATVGADHADKFNQLIAAASGSDNAKYLAASLIPKYASMFPALTDSAVNTMFDLCEVMDKRIRLCAISNLHLLCKSSVDVVPKISDALVQMLVAEDKSEKQHVCSSFDKVLAYDKKGALGGLFGRILSSDNAELRSNAVDFFITKVVPVVRKDASGIKQLVLEQTEKMLGIVTEAQFYQLTEVMVSLGADQEQQSHIMDALFANAQPNSFKPTDDAVVERVLKCFQQAINLEKKGVSGPGLVPSWFNHVYPHIDEISSKFSTQAFKLSAELSKSAKGDQGRACLSHTIALFNKYVDPPATGHPKLVFDKVECLSVILYHLASKAPGAMNRVSGVKVPTSLIGDGSSEDHADKLKPFQARLEALIKACDHYTPILQKVVKETSPEVAKLTPEEATSDQGKRLKTKLQTAKQAVISARNAKTVASTLLKIKTEYPELSIALSWVPLKKAANAGGNQNNKGGQKGPQQQSKGQQAKQPTNNNNNKKRSQATPAQNTNTKRRKVQGGAGQTPNGRQQKGKTNTRNVRR
eukprot:c39018_g1_i1.p1 GENE.c39018_g1_i1~~c39018_g1_i1.p1  ORF type:complete len:554 (-),score=136.90 c39018_g1_i1:40-1674(-)